MDEKQVTDQKLKISELMGVAVAEPVAAPAVEPKLLASQPAPPLTENSPALTDKPAKSARFKILSLLLVIALAAFGYQYRDIIEKAIVTGKDETAVNKPKVLYWVDPMHPAYRSDKPGTAPDCGMDLVPVYAESNSIKTTADSLPSGAFQIDARQQQLIGVQYGETKYQTISKTVRAVGKIAYDETRVVRVHTKIDGWIEQVYADFTGKEIKKDTPLISIYSPDLYQTQQEFLLALKGRNELGASSFREAASGAESLYQATRRRLELWDITAEQINEIEKRGAPIKTVTLYAPADGVVLTRNAYPRQRVMPDTELYTIADLSRIWVIADIYEYEAAEIKLGQHARVTLSYFPGRSYQGEISYIYPQIDNTTRTMKVRIEIENKNFELKPDMFANVEVKIDYGRKLTIPQEAVLDSGREQTVFVALADGYFAPRKIVLGAKVDNNFIVLSGLKAGEKIVTSANFLIDSESRLKSAVAGMGTGHAGHGGGAPAASKPVEDHSQHQQPENKVEPPKPAGHSHF
jgi:RND family efflux transporter MFP subunit